MFLLVCLVRLVDIDVLVDDIFVYFGVIDVDDFYFKVIFWLMFIVGVEM